MGPEAFCFSKPPDGTRCGHEASARNGEGHAKMHIDYRTAGDRGLKVKAVRPTGESGATVEA